MADANNTDVDLIPHPVRGWSTLETYNKKVRRHLKGRSIAAGIRRALYAYSPIAVRPAEVSLRLPNYVRIFQDVSINAVSSQLGVMAEMPWTGVIRVDGGRYVYRTPQELTD